MKAAVWKEIGSMEIEDVDKPEIGENEVLMKVHTCAVCATDYKTFKRGHAVIKPPAVLGHEVAGEVVEAGKNVNNLEEGERVAPAPYISCGECFFCRQGRYSLCENLHENSISPGGFAEFLKFPKRIAERGTAKLSDKLSYEEASLIEPLACTVKDLRTVDVESRESVLVVGAGPMGLMHLLISKAYGVDEVLVSELDQGRREKSLELGADHAIDPTEDNLEENVKEITGGYGADTSIVTVPSGEALRQGFKSVRKGGSVSMFAGLPPSDSEMKLDLNKVHYSEVSFVGSFGFDSSSFEKAHNLLEEGKVDVENLITHRFPLDRIHKAFYLMGEPSSLKIVIQA